MKKKLACLVIAMLMACAAGCGCSQADRVSHNISQEANNFNVQRRLTVLNARTDRVMFEMIGRFSLSNNGTNELEVIVETNPATYKKHFVYLNEWTLYVVEDISGANVDKYHYEINFLPEMVMPITFVSED